MLNLTCEIIIGDYVFTEANSVNIRLGRNLLTGTAHIIMANIDTSIGSPTVLDNAIKVDDEVQIWLGYDGFNVLEFVGYVKEKRPGMPFEIMCEDAMRNMRVPFSKYYSSVTLKALILEMVPDADLTYLPEITLTDFRINQATKYQVLNEIKTNYPAVDIYFRNGKMYAGLPYNQKGGERIVYHLQDTVIKHDLIFTKEGDLKIRVKAISSSINGEPIEIIVGDAAGDSTTLHFSNLSAVELKNQAEAKLKELKIRGNKGKVITWGIPFCKHGDIAQWEDDNYPERRQANFVDEVIIDWGANGFRRTITPGQKADNQKI